MMSDFTDDFAKEVIQSDLCSPEVMDGCSDSELREFKNHFNLTLPSVGMSISLSNLSFLYPKIEVCRKFVLISLSLTP
jgi:hypothetical protein